MTALAMENITLRDLRPWPRNARTHSRKQVRQIADSIKTFGFANPVLIDEENVILAGHGRVEAARLLGLGSVPCVRLSTMTAEQKRAYVIADNKLALNAGWDEEILAEELKHLTSVDLEFDIGVLGFGIGEIDGLIEGLTPTESGDPAEDRLPQSAQGLEVRRGDLWSLAQHRMLCGNALDAADYETLMGGETAQMVFTDPPYNVPIAGHVRTGGEAGGHREFAMANGEMSRPEFSRFLCQAFELMARHAVDGSIHFACMDWRHLREILDAGEAVYAELKNLIVWAKDNGGMGSFYRSRHELIFAFKKGEAPHINSFELGQHGRYRTNVWSYRGVNTFKEGRAQELELHPTVKPVAMIADAIKDVSRRNDVVLDPFAGSGSTLIAAHKTGRRALVMELDPEYCARAIRRWEIYAKDEAVQLACGWPQAVAKAAALSNGADASESGHADAAFAKSDDDAAAALGSIA
jgi:DNA modification methylase